ncbi:MAG: bifunctional folylpolyglutamate synthase/dihydrofolate synthase [Candidatus Brocadiia bacterium]
MSASGPFERGKDALDYLYHFTDYERMVKPRAAATSIFGLARMNQLLDFLGHPEGQLRAVHIAGTKGKGSTAAMTAAILQRAGATVGLYTSPHVQCVRERIMVDGQWIPEQRLVAHVNRMYPYLQESLKTHQTYTPTFFEIFTAAAFLDFLDQGVDYGVLEVGLGGRLDATNVLQPAVCGIAHVSFDHTDKLGDTLALIAGEKAGILKPAVPAVVAPQEPAALGAIRARAEALQAPLRLVGRDIALVDRGRHFAVRTPRRSYPRLRVPLVGRHQRVNAAMAVALAEEAMAARGLRLTSPIVREGLAAVRWRARIERIAERPTVVVDAAHNVASVRALLAALAAEFAYRRLLLVVGISSDKDVEGMLRELLPRAAFVATTASHSPRACSPDELLRRVEALPHPDAIACESPQEALAEARARAGPDDLVCVTGSFYLAGEVLGPGTE